jgi:CheY-like chemotaxis protein
MNENERGQRPLVLIVDPEDDSRDLHGDWFTSLGFEVVCAADAGVAFAIARAWDPDLVVTELRLRRSDGLQLVLQLQAAAATRRIPLLVVTATSQAGALEAASTAGASAALPAGTSFDVLQAHVNSLMTQRARLRSGRKRKRPSLGALLAGAVPDEGSES